MKAMVLVAALLLGVWQIACAQPRDRQAAGEYARLSGAHLD